MAVPPDGYDTALADMAADLEQVTRERDQADSKAAGLLAGTVGALAAFVAVLVVFAGRLGGWSMLFGLASVGVLVVAVAVLGLAIRPTRRGGMGIRWGYVRIARHDPDGLLDAYLAQAGERRLRAELCAVSLVGQSRRVRRKYRLVRWGVDLGVLGLLLAVAAAVLATLG
jgi:hypothetical protein